MCEACETTTPSEVESEIDIETVVADFRNNIETLINLHAAEDKLNERDRSFAADLYRQFVNSHALSGRQWEWVGKLYDRVAGQRTIDGSFKAIMVMFMMAQSQGGLKRPKVRLMSKGKRFVQLTFNVEKPKEVVIHVDGWAGHGYRKFAGTMTENHIYPYASDRVTPDVVEVIELLATDPMGVAKAMANELGACMYCGIRLSDDESKRRGYGPVCAKSWSLPWGKGKA